MAAPVPVGQAPLPRDSVSSERAGDMLARLGTNAELWAREFAEQFTPEGAEAVADGPLDPTPGNMLHVWLCNAIEAGRSAGYSAAVTPAGRSYWRHWHNIRYELDKRLDRLALTVARRLPGRLRMWVVVDSANTSIFALHPRPDGYAGPDGLTYAHIYDGARRKATPGVTA